MRSKRRGTLYLFLFALICCAFFSLRALAVGEEETFLLKLSVSPDHTGVVSVKVDGAGTSDLNIKKDALVTLNAMPAEGYAFDYWDGLESTGISETQQKKEEVTFQMKEPLTVTAVFKEFKTKYTVTIRSNAEDYGAGSFGHKDFAPGEKVKVYADPYEGFKFVHWKDEDGALSFTDVEEGWETKSEFSFTMPKKDVNLFVEFDYVTYYFSLRIQGKGEVEVSGKTKNKQGKYECTVGEEILLSALPAENYVFVNWSGTNSAALSDFDKADTTLTCPASDFTVTANFASSIRNLTLTATEGGTIQPPAGVMSMGVDTILSLSAVPDEGYAFSHWECSSSAGGFKDEKSPDTDFTMPDVDCEVKAVFVKGGYRLTVAASAGGKAEGKEGVYEMGEKVEIWATPLEGYVFSRWQCDVSGVVSSPEDARTEVVIPGEDVKVTAVFVLEASLSPGDSREGDPSGSSFPWGLIVFVFFLSGVAIALVIVRERYNLSYRALIKTYFNKWFRRK